MLQKIEVLVLHVLNLPRGFITANGLTVKKIDLFNIAVLYPFAQSIDAFAFSLSITSLVEPVFALVLFLLS